MNAPLGIRVGKKALGLEGLTLASPKSKYLHNFTGVRFWATLRFFTPHGSHFVFIAIFRLMAKSDDTTLEI